MIRFHLTCSACPEQYNAYKGKEYVGYVRLRHGNFRVEDAKGDTIFRANPKGDGCFDSGGERSHYLGLAAYYIEKSIDPKSTKKTKYVISDDSNFGG